MVMAFHSTLTNLKKILGSALLLIHNNMEFLEREFSAVVS